MEIIHLVLSISSSSQRSDIWTVWPCKYIIILQYQCLMWLVFERCNCHLSKAKEEVLKDAIAWALESGLQDLSNGIWHAYIEQHRGVRYRWKALHIYFSTKIWHFAYLQCTFSRRAWTDCVIQLLPCLFICFVCIWHVVNCTPQTRTNE